MICLFSLALFQLLITIAKGVQTPSHYPSTSRPINILSEKTPKCFTMDIEPINNLENLLTTLAEKEDTFPQIPLIQDIWSNIDKLIDLYPTRQSDPNLECMQINPNLGVGIVSEQARFVRSVNDPPNQPDSEMAKLKTGEFTHFTNLIKRHCLTKSKGGSSRYEVTDKRCILNILDLIEKPALLHAGPVGRLTTYAIINNSKTRIPKGVRSL